ncbi:hypothetical protein D3C85_854000 [compost metagenome]
MKYKVTQDTLHNYTVDEIIHFARVGMDYEGDVGKLVLYAIGKMQETIDELESELEASQSEYDDMENVLYKVKRAIETLEDI